MKLLLTVLIFISMTVLSAPDISFINSGIDKMLFDGAEIERVRFDSKTIFEGSDEEIIAYNSASDFLILTNDGAIVVTGYVGVASSMNIPPTINGFAVTSIQSNAFKNKTTIKSSYVPGSTLKIGDNSFSGCSELTNVVFGSGVKHIGRASFLSCTKMKTIHMQNTVTNIGDEAFKGCQLLQTIDLPTTLEKVNSATFFQCLVLTNISFGGVRNVGFQSFYLCSGLRELEVPVAITNIGEQCFYSTGITNLIINGNPVCGNSAFGGNLSLTNITIAAMTTLYNNMFSGDNQVKYVKLPNTINYIYRYAFNGCSGLYGVFFEGNCPNYDPYGGWFDGCTNRVFRIEAATGWPVVPNNYLGRPTAIWNNYPNIP